VGGRISRHICPLWSSGLGFTYVANSVLDLGSVCNSGQKGALRSGCMAQGFWAGSQGAERAGCGLKTGMAFRGYFSWSLASPLVRDLAAQLQPSHRLRSCRPYGPRSSPGTPPSTHTDPSGLVVLVGPAFLSRHGVSFGSRIIYD
jgi:hypothetical protein